MTEQESRLAEGALPRPRTHTSTASPAAAVTLAVEDVDAVTGVRTRRCAVVDESDASPTRQASQSAFAALDALLAAHPEWEGPQVDDQGLAASNGVSQWIYSSPAMAQWREHLVPTARALYVLQRPQSDHLLPGWGPVDALCRTFVVDGLDGIGIRTRARLMQDVVEEPLRAASQRGGASWVSLACGAAVPVLDTLSRTHLDARLHLVDLDPEALRFAGELARAQGLVEGHDFHLLERNLVSTVVARSTLVDELGAESAAVVDALGIFEYFSDASCTRLLRNAYRLVAPGGVLVVANMLSDRPELALNQRGLGWPSIVPRSVEQVLGLVERAGLPLDRTTVSTAQDGVYAVVSIDRGQSS